jgi:6-pyruvoyltetrahydropterin/6-carboxytetrahydropterin synthase
VLDKVDHKNLNLDVDFMKGKLTSCENLLLEFWRILQPEISSMSDGRASLHCIKLKETNKNYAEYFGE